MYKKKEKNFFLEKWRPRSYETECISMARQLNRIADYRRLSKTMKVFDNGFCFASLLISYFLLSTFYQASGQKRCVASFDDTFGQKRYHERQASLRRSSSISVGAELDDASTRKLEINRGRHRETQNARSFVPLVNNFQTTFSKLSV